MKLQSFFATWLLMLAAAALPSGAARADTVLYDGMSLFQGQQAFADSFTLATPGTLTFTMSTYSFLDPVGDLTGFLSTSSGVVGTTIADGATTESLSVGAGTYSAHWFGDAQGTYNLGVVGLLIAFQPSNVTAVALPSSLILMLSGLGILFGWQHRRGPIAASGR
jgi:hypothetical protein